MVPAIPADMISTRRSLCAKIYPGSASGTVMLIFQPAEKPHGSRKLVDNSQVRNRARIDHAIAGDRCRKLSRLKGPANACC